MISATLAPSLHNFVNTNSLNPFFLWKVLEERFHNQAADLELNVQRFYSARKAQNEKIIDYIAQLSTLRRQITTTDNKVGDDVFMRQIQQGLGDEYLETRGIIAHARNTNTLTLKSMKSIILEHKRVLSQETDGALHVHLRDRRNRGRRRNNHGGRQQKNAGRRHNNHSPVGSPAQRANITPPARSPYDGDAFCQHCQRPGH